MEIKTRKRSEVCILTISGRLDALTSGDLEKEFCALVEKGETKIVFDMSELEYLSSAGLRAILFSAKKIKAVDGEIAFANISGSICDVFEISGFGTMFNIYSSAITAADKIA